MSKKILEEDVVLWPSCMLFENKYTEIIIEDNVTMGSRCIFLCK